MLPQSKGPMIHGRDEQASGKQKVNKKRGGPAAAPVPPAIAAEKSNND
jgi:hypothetical protein